jgi:hypothetical protein
MPQYSRKRLSVVAAISRRLSLITTRLAPNLGFPLFLASYLIPRSAPDTFPNLLTLVVIARRLTLKRGVRPYLTVYGPSSAHDIDPY